MNKPQLFLFHFAGGSRYSYQFLRPYLPDFEFIPLELPGRGKRAKETFLTDYNSVVLDYYSQVLGNTNGNPFLIYGHSMGSVLALSVTHLLEKISKPPVGIVVSGNAGPGMHENKKRFLLENEEFQAELKTLGGVPDEVLLNEDLLNYFLPVLKADFRVLEEHDASRSYSPVNTSIFALMGDGEERSEKIYNWKNFTYGSFGFKIMNGKHFFLYDHAEQISMVIRKSFNSAPDPIAEF